MATRITDISKIAVFDVESTGIKPLEDRIVQAFIGVLRRGGGFTEEHQWFIDPGIEIPEGASSVHGITNERIKEIGRPDTKEAIFEVAQRLDILVRQGIPIVVYNAPYDLTILAAELVRHYPGMRPVVPKYVIDPMVIDKAIDKYRKGKRTLTTVADHYGVPVSENAHDAREDCIMTGRLAFKLIEIANPENTLDNMMELQARWKYDQAKSLEEYGKKNNKEYGDVRVDWPIWREFSANS